MAQPFGEFSELLASGNGNVALVYYSGALASGGNEMGVALSGEKVTKCMLCEAPAKHIVPLLCGAASKGGTATMASTSALCLGDRSAGPIVVKGGASLFSTRWRRRKSSGRRQKMPWRVTQTGRLTHPKFLSLAERCGARRLARRTVGGKQLPVQTLLFRA